MNEMGFANSEQLYELFLSGGMGFLLGGYYDVFRLLRRFLKPGKAVTFALDILFFVTAAFPSFLFSLSMMHGEVRGYELVGLLCGFFAYRYTVGLVVVRTVSRLLDVTERCYQYVCGAFEELLKRVIRRLRPLWDFVREKCQKVCEKPKKFFKKVLQPIRKLVYNHRV